MILRTLASVFPLQSPGSPILLSINAEADFIASTLRGVRRPTGGLNAELLCVLGVQSLPAELHGAGPDDASGRLAREEPIENVPVRGVAAHVASGPRAVYE